MAKDEELIVRPLTPIENANAFLGGGGDIAHLEKMMELQERHEANEARKAYFVAMAEFKKNPPVILKDHLVSYTTKDGKTTSYMHAELGKAANAIGSELAKYGLFASWKTLQEGGAEVICTITHELGHSESTSLKAPPDTSGGKNSIQALGSTVTYLQRYTLLALTGIAPRGIDDDGKGTDPDPEPGNQAGQEKQKPFLKPGDKNWESAKASYVDHNKSFEGIFKHVQMTEEHQKLMAEECKSA